MASTNDGSTCLTKQNKCEDIIGPTGITMDVKIPTEQWQWCRFTVASLDSFDWDGTKDGNSRCTDGIILTWCCKSRHCVINFVWGGNGGGTKLGATPCCPSRFATAGLLHWHGRSRCSQLKSKLTVLSYAGPHKSQLLLALWRPEVQAEFGVETCSFCWCSVRVFSLQ